MNDNGHVVVCVRQHTLTVAAFVSVCIGVCARGCALLSALAIVSQSLRTAFYSDPLQSLCKLVELVPIEVLHKGHSFEDTTGIIRQHAGFIASGL